jgi:hypothetical protein
VVLVVLVVVLVVLVVLLVLLVLLLALLLLLLWLCLGNHDRSSVLRNHHLARQHWCCYGRDWGIVH